MANPKENQTVALMEVVLYKIIFIDDHFAVTSEQLPSLDSERRYELVIKYLSKVDLKTSKPFALANAIELRQTGNLA
jgi:hypothetical protein